MIKVTKTYVKKLLPKIDTVLVYLCLLCSAGILFNLGYNTDMFSSYLLDRFIKWGFYLIGTTLTVRTLLFFNLSGKFHIITYSEILLLLYFFLIFFATNLNLFSSYIDFRQPEWMYVGIFSTLLIEVSKNSLFFDRFYFNPTILFVLSFLFLILLGTFLLLLPKATYGENISFLDALFTSTSAVCITGLSVFDFATKLTPFGQHILLFLFQLGGLGIMTFTGFFGYFFTGGFSYKNQLMYTEIIGEDKLASVIRTLYKIILITFLFEAVGAIFIYFSVDSAFFTSKSDQLYFSVFHAISAFCNAGFSYIENGLHHPQFRYNYNLLLILSFLIILGGLGFGIVFNIYSFFKRWLKNLYNFIFYKEPFSYKAWVISFNSRIILYTTLVLVLLGSVSFFILEYNNTLQEHTSLWGKSMTAFFMGITPRTAGFSTVNIAEVTYPILLIYLLLMWVGASPGSTGGGIKNTTFAIAFLNIFSIARGKDHIEIFKRQVSSDTVRRALSIISLSFFVIGTAILILSITDGELGLKALTFDVFSAFSTAGLTLGKTAQLSNAGKIVLIFTMFIGRVGALTLLIAFIKNSKLKAYRYPTENVDL